MADEMYRTMMHLPFEGNPDDQGGIRLSFSCGFDTVIPIEIIDESVQRKIEQCRCPGCGAPCNVLSVVYRQKAPD